MRACALALFFLGTFLHAQSDVDKIARLESHIDLLAEESESARLISGWTLVGTGILCAGTGVLIAEIISDFPTQEKTIVEVAFVASGMLFSGTGVLLLVIPGEAEILAGELSRMDRRTESETARYIQRGEVILESLAAHAKQGRLVSGITLLAAGAGEIVMYLVLGDQLFGGNTDDSLLYAMIGSAIVNCSMGLLSLLMESPAEMEWKSYNSWRQAKSRQTEDEARNAPTLSEIGILPTPVGMAFRVAVSF